jgi:hypothetical protein
VEKNGFVRVSVVFDSNHIASVIPKSESFVLVVVSYCLPVLCLVMCHSNDLETHIGDMPTFGCDFLPEMMLPPCAIVASVNPRNREQAGERNYTDLFRVRAFEIGLRYPYEASLTGTSWG